MAVFGSYFNLSAPNQHCTVYTADTGLPKSYDGRGFVGKGGTFSSPKVITTCHGSFWWSRLYYELGQLWSDEHSICPFHLSIKILTTPRPCFG
jgi:hypothetical protein